MGGATTLRSWGSRRGGRSGACWRESAVPRSGVLVATNRCYVLWPADARPPPRHGWLALRPVDGEMSAGSPTLPSVEDKHPGTAGGSATAVTAVPANAVSGDAPPRWSPPPSRAADFLTCPLLYRFRVIDPLPEAPSQAMARGTLVHAVLERLFDRPAANRSPEAAGALIAPEWDRLVAAEPELAALFADQAERGAWLAQAKAMIGRYFTLEDPTRLEPAHRELHVEAVAAAGLRVPGDHGQPA